jgi:Flp pilus assembly protein TadD
LIGIYVAVVWSFSELVRPASWVGLAASVCVLTPLAVLTRRQVGFWHDTRTLFEHTLAVTHDNPLANQVLGNALISDGETKQAIPLLEEALRLAPDFAEAHNNLGTALGSLGRIDEALSHFKAALRTDPKSAATHYNLGFAFGNLGRFDEAIDEYRESLRLEPGQSIVHRKLALALGAEGHYAEAADHLHKALELRPKDVDIMRELAISLVRTGDVEGAITEYRRILDSDPSDLDALNNIAWIRATHAAADHRNSSQAVELAERAVGLANPPNSVLFDTLAAAYAEAGRFGDAVRACDRAIELAKAQGDSAAAARFSEHRTLFAGDRPLHLQ